MRMIDNINVAISTSGMGGESKTGRPIYRLGSEIVWT